MAAPPSTRTQRAVTTIALLALLAGAAGCADSRPKAGKTQSATETAREPRAANPGSQRVYVATAPWIPRDSSRPFLRIPGLGVVTAHCSEDDHATITLRLGRLTPTSTAVVRTDDAEPVEARIDPEGTVAGANPGDPALLESWLLTPISKASQRVISIDVAGGRSYTNSGCTLSVRAVAARAG